MVVPELDKVNIPQSSSSGSLSHLSPRSVSEPGSLLILGGIPKSGFPHSHNPSVYASGSVLDPAELKPKGAPFSPAQDKGKEDGGPSLISNSAAVASHFAPRSTPAITSQTTSLTPGIPEGFSVEHCVVCLSLGWDALHDWSTCAVSQNPPRSLNGSSITTRAW